MSAFSLMHHTVPSLRFCAVSGGQVQEQSNQAQLAEHIESGGQMRAANLRASVLPALPALTPT